MVFGGDILKMMNFKMIDFKEQYCLQEHPHVYARTLSRLCKKISEDYTRHFQETALSKGEC
jgi:hypothetical protein